MDALDILIHDYKRIENDYVNAQIDVRDCASKVANGNYSYCASLQSAIARMNEQKARLESFGSALETVQACKR